MLLIDELMREQLKKRITEELDKRMKEIKDATEKMIKEATQSRSKEFSQKIRDIYRPRKTFNYQLKNVSAFFQNTSKQFSKFFNCFSFKWSILIDYEKTPTELSDSSKFLQLYLLREETLGQDELSLHKHRFVIDQTS